jgi:hypothetical protein
MRRTGFVADRLIIDVQRLLLQFSFYSPDDFGGKKESLPTLVFHFIDDSEFYQFLNIDCGGAMANA